MFTKIKANFVSEIYMEMLYNYVIEMSDLEYLYLSMQL